MCQRPSGLGQVNGSEQTYNQGNTDVSQLKNGNNDSFWFPYVYNITRLVLRRIDSSYLRLEEQNVKDE